MYSNNNTTDRGQTIINYNNNIIQKRSLVYIVPGDNVEILCFIQRPDGQTPSTETEYGK